MRSSLPVLLRATAWSLFVCPAFAQEDPTPEQGLTWADLLKSDSHFKLYGFIRLDAMYDDSRMNDPQIPFLVLSEDGSPPGGVPAGTVADKNDDEFALSARLTRLGLDLDGPTIEVVGSADLSGKIEIDFYNIGLNDSDSRYALRIRLAYLELDWGAWSLLAGQDWDVISPLYPAVNHDLVMWNASNTGDRRPQLTVKNEWAVGKGKIETRLSAGLTGAVASSNVVGGLRSGENSGRPMWSARVGYHGATGGGAPYHVGIWGHDSEEEFDATGSGSESTFDSHSLGADARVPIFSKNFWLMGEYWMGENLRDVRGGIGQGVNPTTGEEIEAAGGWAELSLMATEHVTLHAGYALDDPENDDLANFQASKNTIPYVAARWRYGSLRFGLEYLYWTTEYVGLDDGDANRIVGWIAYYF